MVAKPSSTLKWYLAAEGGGLCKVGPVLNRYRAHCIARSWTKPEQRVELP